MEVQTQNKTENEEKRKKIKKKWETICGIKSMRREDDDDLSRNILR